MSKRHGHPANDMCPSAVRLACTPCQRSFQLVCSRNSAPVSVAGKRTASLLFKQSKSFCVRCKLLSFSIGRLLVLRNDCVANHANPARFRQTVYQSRFSGHSTVVNGASSPDKPFGGARGNSQPGSLQRRVGFLPYKGI